MVKENEWEPINKNDYKTSTDYDYKTEEVLINSDLFKMFDYCRNNGVVPNITINGYNLTDDYAAKLASVCGAISVSRYQPKEVCYNAVKKLTDNGLKQVNIHMVAAKDTYEDCFDLMQDAKNDERLRNLNAIVFLLLKPKGKRNNLKSLTLDEYKKIVRHAMDNKIRVGTDSCAAPLFLKSLTENELEVNLKYIESCESFGLFSCYINVDGDYYPCSFAEGASGWEIGMSVLNCENFLKDVWHSDKLKSWRKISLDGSLGCSCAFKKYCRPCPIYNITPCKVEICSDET